MTLLEDQSREELCNGLSFIGVAIESLARQLKSDTVKHDFAFNEFHRLIGEAERLLDRLTVLDSQPREL